MLSSVSRRSISDLVAIQERPLPAKARLTNPSEVGLFRYRTRTGRSRRLRNSATKDAKRELHHLNIGSRAAAWAAASWSRLTYMLRGHGVKLRHRRRINWRIMRRFGSACCHEWTTAPMSTPGFRTSTYHHQQPGPYGAQLTRLFSNKLRLRPSLAAVILQLAGIHQLLHNHARRSLDWWHNRCSDAPGSATGT